MRGLLLSAALTLAAFNAEAQTVTATSSSSGSNVAISGTHVFFGFHVTPTGPVYVMVFDSASVPANGAVTPNGCFYVTPQSAAASTLGMANTPAALLFTNGIVVVTSSTGCFTKTETPSYISVIWQ